MKTFRARIMNPRRRRTTAATALLLLAAMTIGSARAPQDTQTPPDVDSCTRFACQG